MMWFLVVMLVVLVMNVVVVIMFVCVSMMFCGWLVEFDVYCRRCRVGCVMLVLMELCGCVCGCF